MDSRNFYPPRGWSPCCTVETSSVCVVQLYYSPPSITGAHDGMERRCTVYTSHLDPGGRTFVGFSRMSDVGILPWTYVPGIHESLGRVPPLWMHFYEIYLVGMHFWTYLAGMELVAAENTADFPCYTLSPVLLLDTTQYVKPVVRTIWHTTLIYFCLQ